MCNYARSVYSVCAHYSVKFNHCTAAQLPIAAHPLNVTCTSSVSVQFVLGWCWQCKTLYRPVGDAPIRNFWAYKNAFGLDRPMNPGAVPHYILNADAPIVTNLVRAVRCEELALEAAFTGQCGPVLQVGINAQKLRPYLVRICQSTLEWAAAAKAEADKPGPPFHRVPDSGSRSGFFYDPETLDILCSRRGSYEAPSRACSEVSSTATTRTIAFSTPRWLSELSTYSTPRDRRSLTLESRLAGSTHSVPSYPCSPSTYSPGTFPNDRPTSTASMASTKQFSIPSSLAGKSSDSVPSYAASLEYPFPEPIPLPSMPPFSCPCPVRLSSRVPPTGPTSPLESASASDPIPIGTLKSRAMIGRAQGERRPRPLAPTERARTWEMVTQRSNSSRRRLSFPRDRYAAAVQPLCFCDIGGPENCLTCHTRRQGSEEAGLTWI